MSEPMFPAPPAEQEPVENPEAGSRRTFWLAVGGVAAAVVVAGGAFLMLSGGSEPAAPPLVPPAAAGSPSAAPTVAPSPVIKPASISVAKRDPFAPLYPTPTATPTPTPPEPPPSPDPNPTIPDPDPVPPIPDPWPTPPDPQPTTPDPTPTPTPTPVTKVKLRVWQIDEQNEEAWFSFNGKKDRDKVAVGDEFGADKQFQLVGVLDAKCVSLLYGDEAQELCKGDVLEV